MKRGLSYDEPRNNDMLSQEDKSVEELDNNMILSDKEMKKFIKDGIKSVYVSKKPHK